MSARALMLFWLLVNGLVIGGFCSTSETISSTTSVVVSTRTVYHLPQPAEPSVSGARIIIAKTIRGITQILAGFVQGVTIYINPNKGVHVEVPAKQPGSG